jgi:hypothetical protein
MRSSKDSWSADSGSASRRPGKERVLKKAVPRFKSRISPNRGKTLPCTRKKSLSASFAAAPQAVDDAGQAGTISLGYVFEVPPPPQVSRPRYPPAPEPATPAGNPS